MTRRTLRDSQILSQAPAARRRAKRLLCTTPHAAEVHFDPGARDLEIRLTNGAALSIPVAMVPALRSAPGKDLGEVRVGPAGVGLRWERLDLDLSVANLLRLALGTQVLMRAAGSAGGSSRSSVKAQAARRNGRKGGRPRKTAVRSKG